MLFVLSINIIGGVTIILYFPYSCYFDNSFVISVNQVQELGQT